MGLGLGPELGNNFRVKMSDRRKSHLVHSLSMFQTKPVESKGNSYQPPLFTTSSCNSILDESRRSNGYARQNATTRRSQSGEAPNRTMDLRSADQNLLFIIYAIITLIKSFNNMIMVTFDQNLLNNVVF